MGKYILKTQYLNITENTTLPPENYGGWSLVNTGRVPLTVNGVVLDPAGPLIAVDYTFLRPDVIWSDNISIKFSSDEGNRQATLTRLQYSYIED